MKKLLQILAKVPLPMIAVVGLVMVVLVFANPWVLLSDAWSGMTEEVNGFDVPVPVLDEEFDLALLGKKGTWYDHKVSVTNIEPAE